MATPPKPTPRKPAVKKVAVPAKAGAKPASRPKPASNVAKGDAVPFVIESENLSSFVDKSDSTLPSAKPVAQPAPEPVVAKADAKPEPAAPLKVAAVKAAPAPKPAEPVVEAAKPDAAKPDIGASARDVPAAAPPVAVKKEIKDDIKASLPSQPAVAEKMVAAMEQAAQWQAPNALEGHYIMNEAIETSKKFAEDAKSRFQTIVTDFNEKAKVAVEKSSKTAEELGDIAKGNLEALVESSKIAAKGFESLGQNAAEYGRQSFEKTSATLKSFASVKSPTEFFQLHSELVTSTFDTLAAETAKTSEAVLKLVGEISQPLSNRYAVVSDKLKALAA
ncbi:MAG: phasin family protein [Sphingobium sp.]